MFEHLYGYGQQQEQKQQQGNNDKPLHSFGTETYDYGGTLTDVHSTTGSLPAFAFLSQHSALPSQLHLQECHTFNGFSHDTTSNTNDTGSDNNLNGHDNQRSSSMDDHNSGLGHFSAFESLDQHDMGDATFSIPHLYHQVDISSIVHSPVLAVPELPTTLPPLHSPTAVLPQTSSATTTTPTPTSTSTSTTSVIPADNLPASKKQRLARGFRERAPWTAEEDNLLRLAVQLYGDKTEKWAKIAACVQGRTNKNCRKRWFHSLDPSLRKGAWTDEEDRLLREGVKKFPNQWSKIADLLEGRTDDQCAKRWRESLDPTIDRSDWTLAEDLRLADKFEEYGSQWQKIAQYFDGRPGLHCRNRWRKLQRISQIKKEKERSSLYLSSSPADGNDNKFTTTTTTTTRNNSHSGTKSNSSSTPFINMGPDESITTRFHHHHLNGSLNSTTSNGINIVTSAPQQSSSANLTASISALISSSSTTPSSISSMTESSSSPSPSTMTRSIVPLSQHQSFHTTSRPQHTVTTTPSSTTSSNTTTTFNSINDRRQQDYEAPEPLGHLNPYGCDVPGCYDTFSQSSELFYHMKNVHPDLSGVAKPYRCAVVNCPKKYKNINGLQYHLRDAKGTSGHALAISTSPPLENHQGEQLLTPTPTTATATTTIADTTNNNKKDKDDDAQLNDVLMDNNSCRNEMGFDRLFTCPMIDCKESFSTLQNLRLHQDHQHSNPFQLAAITALTNPLVESCLLQQPTVSSTSQQQQQQQQQQSQQQQQQFRISREKWIMESV
ncbi:hypothetical protein BC941DRAFT_451377 [Chlamydoabsidia padenii]|nr:hypothetical protein BC941DRAFT_451377 [Chlamydoabsidia padenii]